MPVGFEEFVINPRAARLEASYMTRGDSIVKGTYNDEW